MKFQCPFCGCAIFNVKEGQLGTDMTCPNCSKHTIIPTDSFGAGRIITDFIIKEKIGEGSIGTVYLAHQISLDRKVALKVLSPKYATLKGMSAFMTEARAAANLSHPNLVQCVGLGDDNGIYYMAMNYINGLTLKQKIESEGRMVIDEALHIIQQVAESLHFAWEEAKLIHRDVKPENIMIDENGVVKLTDLGLAMQEKDWHENMEISGSPSYMSPEQFIGGKLDTRSDIYSLGITLYQMLSGRLPFRGKTLNTIAKQHFKEKSIPLSKLNPLIPKNVSELVAKMTAKNPSDRFNNMNELLKQIWQIRQITAPDKELVPDIHTVSLKKLDYDLQIESQKKKIQVMKAESEEQQKHETYIKILAFFVPVLVLSIMIVIGIRHRRDREYNNRLSIIEGIEKMFQEETGITVLSEELDKVKKKLSALDQKTEEGLSTRLALVSEKIENKKLMERNKVLETRVSALALRLNDMEPKTKAFSKTDADLKQKELKIKEIEISLSALEFDLKKEKNLVKKRNEEIIFLRSQETETWKNDIRVKLHLLAKSAKFAEASSLLKLSAGKKNASDDEWLDAKKTEMAQIEKLFLELENSGQRFSGLEISKGIIKEIKGSAITVANKNIPIKEEDILWKNLPIEDLKILTTTFNPSPKEAINLITYYFAIMTGNFSDAVDVFGKNDEAQNTMLAVRQYQLENIRYFEELDAKKAALKAKEFLKNFDKTDDITAIRNELKTLIEWD
jgi:hypothetical protein